MVYISKAHPRLARRRAVDLITVYGYSRAGAARRVRVHRSTVTRWCQDWDRRDIYTSYKRRPRARRQAVTYVRLCGWSNARVSRRFGVHRATVGRWVSKASCLNGTEAIRDESSRPHRPGNGLDAHVYERIVSLRRETERCAPVLRELLRREGVTVSVAAVGRALRRFGYARPPRKRAHYAVLAPRPRARYPGDLVQVDVLHVMRPSGTRYYVVTLIDVASRWAFAAYQTRCGSATTLATVHAAQRAAPFRFKMIQTDRGVEFAETFCEDILRSGMRVRHIRPHRPNDNAHIERFNRTLREECVARRPVPRVEMPKKIKRYLHYYNAHRPHMSLGYAAPLDEVAALRRTQ